MVGEGEVNSQLGIFATHPIQYQVPWFRALAAESWLDAQVYYAMLPDAVQQGAGFGVEFEWDIPLCDGYSWQLLENRASKPSLDRFRGCNVSNIDKLLSARRPHAALISGWNSFYLLQVLHACRRLRIPTLVRGDSNILAPRGIIKRGLQRMLFSRFFVFLAVGQFNHQLYRRAGIPEKRIFFCPHFIENERFSLQTQSLVRERFELRRRWSIPGDAVCFVFVGKLMHKKRIMDFLRAIDVASQKDKCIFGLVVGAGEEKEMALSFVKSRRLPVTFAGFLNQSEIVKAYVASDCLVLPSDYNETWGLVVNEAMACGIPAIVSDEVGCGPDLVKCGVTGGVFPCGNVSALSRTINDFASNGQRLESMGKTAQRRVSSEFSLERATAGIKQALRYVLENYFPVGTL